MPTDYQNDTDDTKADENLFQIEYVTNLSPQHKYFPVLHKYKGKIDKIYEHPKKKGKLMLKLPLPNEPDKEAYISLKHIEILTATFRGISLFPIRKLMDQIVANNVKLPVRVLTINPFRGTQFEPLLIMYVSDKENKIYVANNKNQVMKPLDHLRQNLYVIASNQDPKQLNK